MPYFDYMQNNSGGRFNGPAITVIIEAETAAGADLIAEEHGVYFDGCETETDCPCCGDRWHRAWSDGDPVPSLYGEPIEEGKTRSDWSRDEVPSFLVVHADGRTQRW